MDKKTIVPISIVVILVVAVAGGALLMNRGNQSSNNGLTTTPETTETTSTIAPGEPTSGNGSGSTDDSRTTEVNTTGETQSKYQDGTYTADGDYTSPAGPEKVGVTLTIENDTITAVSIEKKASNQKSVQLQTLFSEGISGQVVGKKLDEASVSKVNGSSLTPIGFNNAVATIKTQAM